MFPVLDSRHQFDSEQVGQPEDRFALSVAVGMNDLGLNLAHVFHQAIENVNSFTHAAGNEMGEQRDVLIADQVIRLSEGLRYVKEVVSF
jgi:hypothetical protein